ncbi:hypothetical protein H6F42_17600 [Pseudanabaena sp. FACHB-1998]|uniref:hypothetical protein n=1 Tax=Pseudanabaena sp. FACHB-1998 TaxID=2692858 RepID=UPI0016811234|nr:hypothetical protein [Pseudanabaena sp. FACHB-1998]MBD2178737.1 hypothetical protein [Pseudanabaena sp. FACHB-1998]
MSVPESCTALSIDDILASLEMRLEIEEVCNIQPLTKALEQGLSFAKDHKLTDLADVIKLELEGYMNQPPSDRFVQLSYFDHGGQIIDGLNQYRIYPLVIGVRKLELHVKNGLTLILPKQILNFLSEVVGREVESGHISPAEINKILESIRNKFLRQFLIIKG